MNNQVFLTNIQRFSLHDGPGIRTTVFCKGCSLHCPWCSNPENLSNHPQNYIKNSIPGTYGKYYEPEALVHECLKDKKFYEEEIDYWNINTADEIKKLPGGVTFSGGEALLQMEALVPVITSLHEENVHVAVETCLFVPSHLLALAIDHIDFFYVDMKILDAKRCKEVENGNLDLYLDNLHTLLSWKDENGHRKPVVIRIPVIGSYTDDEHNRAAVKQLISRYRESVLKIELIKEHNLGESKYKSLGISLDYHGVKDSLMEKYKSELANLGIVTEVCKI